MINHVFPDIGDSVLTALQALGMNIIIPADQGCCGLPALCAGDGKGAARLADRNLAAMTAAQADVIVTACASCHSGLTTHFRGLGPEHESLADKVMDIHTFLERHGLTERLRELPRQGQPRAVAYHVPCHLRQPDLVDAPRRLLKALPSVRFVDMPHADACCGLGGTFSVYHYETSMAIGAQKAEGVRASEAQWVATACPGCIMQLQDILSHAGLPHPVVHVLELIAGELQQAGPEAAANSDQAET
jgi:glycolate oxidase iron-sulfur subunit